jgi:hypothetical protein
VRASHRVGGPFPGCSKVPGCFAWLGPSLNALSALFSLFLFSRACTYLQTRKAEPESGQPGSDKLSDGMQERAILAMGNLVRNARIRDWIQQSPGPMLCEKHQAWGSVSSDDAASSLSDSATWENLPLSVSMRSLHDFEAAEIGGGDKTTCVRESDRARKAYQELSQRYKATNKPKQFNTLSSHADISSRHNSEESLERTSRPGVARVLDLQLHDSPRSENAGGAQVESHVIAGLQQISASRSASASTADDNEVRHTQHSGWSNVAPTTKLSHDVNSAVDGDKGTAIIPQASRPSPRVIFNCSERSFIHDSTARARAAEAGSGGATGARGYGLTLDTSHAISRVPSTNPNRWTTNLESPGALQSALDKRTTYVTSESASTPRHSQTNRPATLRSTPPTPNSPQRGRFSALHGNTSGFLSQSPQQANRRTEAESPKSPVNEAAPLRPWHSSEPKTPSPLASHLQHQLQPLPPNRPLPNTKQPLLSPRPTHVPPPPSLKHSADPAMRRTPAVPMPLRKQFGHHDVTDSTATKDPAPTPVAVSQAAKDTRALSADPQGSIDCAHDEDYVDVFEFMAQRQSATPRPSKFSIDRYLSSATLSLIEQQRLSASIATLLPPACGTHAEVRAETHEAAATAGAPRVPVQAAQSIDSNNFRPGNDAHTEIKSVIKDPLSMRIDMETEILATTVDSDREESASSSPVGAAGCMSWVKPPAMLRRSELQRGLSHTNRTSESLLFRHPDNSWFGGILGGRVTSTSSSKQLSASNSMRASANSVSDTNQFSTEPSGDESTLKVMRLLCERVRACGRELVPLAHISVHTHTHRHIPHASCVPCLYVDIHKISTRSTLILFRVFPRAQLGCGGDAGMD